MILYKVVNCVNTMFIYYNCAINTSQKFVKLHEMVYGGNHFIVICLKQYSLSEAAGHATSHITETDNVINQIRLKPVNLEDADLAGKTSNLIFFHYQ